MKEKILVVEDERNIAELIRLYLEKEGFEVIHAPDGGAGIAEFERTAPDLVLLDIMLPVMDGWQVLKEIRASSKTPVIMLTARDTEYDRVEGLDAGADDFISKPFGMMELVARVRAVLRRTEQKMTEREFRSGPLYMCPERHEVLVDGNPVTLTFKEFMLLQLLVENRGLVLTREILLERIWGLGAERENRTLDVHIRTLRAKLGNAGSLIQTVRGVGYRFTEV